MARRTKEEMTSKGTSKYARKIAWRRVHVNGLPLPCCYAHEWEACRLALTSN